MIKLLLLLTSFSTFAGFTVPSLPNPVNDYSNVLTPSGKENIAKALVDLKNNTGAQMGILIVDSLDGDSIEEASMKVAETWKLGQEGSNNGVLLMLAISDRKMRLEVGSGLEHIITDYEASGIISNMKSYLRSKNYELGILNAVNTVSNKITLNKAEMYAPKPKKDFGLIPTVIGLVLSILATGFAIVLRNKKRKKLEDERKKIRHTSETLTGKLIEDREFSKQLRRAQLNSRTIAGTSESKRGTTNIIAPIIVATNSDDEDRRRSSYSSSSSDDSSFSSSSSSSDWGGGGGDFSGGGGSGDW